MPYNFIPSRPILLSVVYIPHAYSKGFRAERGRRRLGDLANSSEANTTLLPQTRLHDMPNKDNEDAGI